MVDADPSSQDVRALEPESWALAEALVSAGAGTDAGAYLAVCRRCSHELNLAQQRVLGVYIGYLLRAAALLTIRRPATADDLRSLAVSAHPHVAIHLRITVTQVLATLETAHDLDPPATEIGRGDFVVFGAATIAALLQREATDLDELKQSLARWWQANDEELQRIVGEL